MVKRFLVDESDKCAGLLGIIFGLALTIWLTLCLSRPIYITAGFLSILACGTYLFLRKYASSSSISFLALTEGRIPLYLATNIAFFLLFVYSLLCFDLRPNLYTRPLGYFATVALMASIVAVEIFFLPSVRCSAHFTLSKIVLISLSLQFSQLLVFPSIVGVDPWWHQMFTLNILNMGHIPEGYAYSKLPFMHLMIGFTSLVTGLGYKMATMLSISILQVVLNTLVTYLLGNFLLNKKIGLLGSLFLAVGNWSTCLGYGTIPNTIAPGFGLVIIYLLLKVSEDKPNTAISLAMLLMGGLILTHTVAAMWFAILLFAFWGAFKVSNYPHHQVKRPVTLTISILFVVGMLSWWTYASGHIRTLGELIKWGFSLDYFLMPMPEEVTEYISGVPFSEQLFNQLGMFLFFAMSLVGCLYMISKKFGNSHSFVMAIGGGVTLALSFFPLIAGWSIIAERWLYFSQILLALPLAVSFFLLCWVIKNELAKSVLLVSLTFSLSLLMILSPTANLDNPTFSPNTQVRYAFTESELQAIETASNMGNKTIGVDTYYSEFQFMLYPVQDVSEQIYSKNYTLCQDMFILIRKEIVNHPFKLIQTTYRLDYDPQGTLTTEGFCKVYDCDSVSGFLYEKKE